MSLLDAFGYIGGFNECITLFDWVRSKLSSWGNQSEGTHEQTSQDGVLPQFQSDSGREEQQLEDGVVRKLQSDLRSLEEMLPAIYDLIDRAEWRSHNDSVANLLPKLKDAVYDAGDLLDEFGWYRMKVMVEGDAAQLCPFIEFFCSIVQGSFNKVTDTQTRLIDLSSQLEKIVPHEAIPRFDKSLRPVTTSFRIEKIFGREKELDEVIRLLGVPSSSSGSSSKRKRTSSAANNQLRISSVPVLPIVGIGGVGKTTLAQEITTKVKSHFDKIIWICVSDDFDVLRFTKVLIKNLSSKEVSTDELDFLQQILFDEVREKKFLLILDDIWPDALVEDGRCWRKFCAPLTNVIQGSMLLVTTRFAEVADVVGTMESFGLEGLKYDVFWDFFKLCVFGSEDYPIDTQLELIGRSILPKLKGSPLAAITIGKLLGKSLNPAHWNDILNSELWQLKQKKTDILPALRLSYMYLPSYLKRCFSFCGVYPKDYNFEKASLAEIWVAEGFVEPQGSIPLEHIGDQYFEDLVNLSFFQKHRGKYVIHDLMHDMAQLVSKEECFVIKNASDIEMVPVNVRHLSILRSCDVKLGNLLSLCKRTKLRTLFCNKSLRTCHPVMDRWFGELRYLRVIFCASTKELPESIGNLKLLRYLEISRSCHFKSFPSSFCSLYNLQTFYARRCKFGGLPRGVSKLINLKKFEFEPDIPNMEVDAMEWGEQFWNIMNKLNQNTRDLTIYNVGAIRKDATAEVGLQKEEYLNSLTLSWSEFRSPEHNEVEVLQALQPPGTIKSVHLNGYPGEYFPSWFGVFGSTTFGSLTEISIEGYRKLSSLEQFLHPTFVPAIRKIVIADCTTVESVPTEWFQYFPLLEELKVHNCPNITQLLAPSLRNLILQSSWNLADRNSIDPSPHTLYSTWSDLTSVNNIDCSCLTNLHLSCSHMVSIELQKWCLPVLQTLKIGRCQSLTFIRESDIGNRSTGKFPLLTHLTIEFCNKLETLDDLLTHECLPAIESITIRCCDMLSLATERFGGLSSLKVLDISRCPRLNWQSGTVLPPSLQSLFVWSGGDFSACFPSCLENLTSLESLTMWSCQGVVSIPGYFWSSNIMSLQKLRIVNCPDLVSIGGPRAIAYINRVRIRECPKLKELKQPLSKGDWW